MCAHRLRDPKASLEAGDPSERMRHSLEREGVGHHAAAVDRGQDRLQLDLRGVGHLGEHRRLARVLGQSIARVGQPIVRQSRSIAACFPEQLCSSARRLEAAFEVVLGRTGLREQTADGLELLRPVEVRRAGDRDLVVGEVRHHPHDRQRLERLRRAAQVRDERGVAARLDDLTVEDRDRVNVMPGFDDVAASYLDDDPLHGR